MSSQADPSWCQATLEDKAVTTFRWVIYNFNNHLEKGTEKLESTCFNVNGPGDLKMKWQLEIYPKKTKGEAWELRRELNCDVCLNYKGPANIKAKYKAKVNMDITDSVGYARNMTDGPKEFETSGVGSVCLLFEKHAYFMPGGNLTIQCKVAVFGPEKILSGSEDFENTDLSIHHCQKQLGELGKVLSDDKEFTDIKIQCEGQSFDCHMVILAARSPVFKAMFESNMKEKETKTVNLDDFKPNVIAEMLNFIYTGTVASHDTLGVIALELLRAADKYELDHMKNICEDSLCSTVEVTNCVEYLVFGDMYQTLRLKRRALRMLVDNLDSITSNNSDILEDLCKERPGLAVEVMKESNKKK